MSKGGKPWLVTGAAGFLGSHVVEKLLERGAPVLALDDFSTGPRAHLRPFQGRRGFTLLEENICRTRRLAHLLKKLSPQGVIHLAALHFIPAAEADPDGAVHLNVFGTRCVLTACRLAGVEKIFFASTADVYAPARRAHAEDDALKPFNIYGLTKLMGEQMLALEARRRPRARFIAGRLFNLYGPRETNPHILPEIIGQLKRRPCAPLRLGDLSPRRDLVPVEEAAEAVIELASSCPPGVTTVNIATGASWSMGGALALIGKALGRRLEVAVDPSKLRPVERPHLQAEVSRLRRLIGWSPHANLRGGLERLFRLEGLLR